MKSGFLSMVLGAFCFVAVLHAELPVELQGEALNFDRAMKEYDDTEAAITYVDQHGYLLVLEASRKRYERTKKTELVAAIDLEIKAANAGPLTGEPPARLPGQLLIYRRRSIDAPAKAVKAVASVRRSARDRYLKWPDGMADAAKRVRNTRLGQAVAGEKERVLAGGPKAQEDNAPKPDPTRPAEAGTTGKGK